MCRVYLMIGSLSLRNCNKEPELLLNHIKAVLEKIETQEAMEYESDIIVVNPIMYLLVWSSTLLYWQQSNLNPSNNQLRDAALVLAQMIGNSSLVQKLNKLCFLDASNPTFDEENSPTTSSESNLARLEDSIHQAAKKLEFVKLRRVKSNVLKTTDGDVGNNNRWVITKSWNSCPIGMLPCDVGSSGQLPVLDCDDDDKYLKPLESKEQRALNEGMLSEDSIVMLSFSMTCVLRR
ncbi:hypothetical protein LOK49_LG15G02357 [Camellia lanceoleosa]|uniref:Uncharacterized protein n=1 Tax=Camellia lanceoleosa TaxID=1840588 RepID=A0ACC0F323_9ERIC|nr:hypothetical protein LOK49_LG15G02357 [Camellia lanceoleosa]